MTTFAELWDAAWKVLAIGLILGAGLPALFALGVRGVALAAGNQNADDSVRKGNPAGAVLAFVAFTVVILAVVFGIATIIAQGHGMIIDFHHFPPFRHK
ncbi:hypothetical protein [Jongsikchunia kroppenstedtii]|uniref:hypothetical protein n=1 Tax=Jongsikchunia kroppenstedtii TaxID=1121721 RepID=UPI0003633CF9|nr:hypothetical protein [Jongsikchunia kroppenstedtii]